MKTTNSNSLFSIIFIITAFVCINYFTMPQSYDETEAPLSNFSTKRALEKVKEISQKPHFVGSQNHEVVAQFLIKELQNLGLQPSIQEGFTLTESGTLVHSKNIIAKIKGSKKGKALLLLSHYDSAPHSFSKGASDDASGVATILEGVRAFLHNNSKPKNDVVILFSDAEELGLNGAALFVTQHNWASNIGLAINFEARGSSGPGYMLMETNQGNAKMVEEFAKAKIKMPVANSLMYSIYKMLPNDTDLTVFREKGKIQGYNFAFIDSHFNYHSMQDKYENLDPKTLAHQGSYLVPMLNYFSNANLSDLNSTSDKVYFTIPFTFISYSYSWILPLLVASFLIFAFIIFLGLGKRKLHADEIIKGFVPFFGALFTSAIVTFIGWKIIKVCYPQYADILHGFTYNGHDYIAAFVFITLSICFLFYRKESKRNSEMNQLIAPLFLWFVFNLLILIYLKGAGFLIIPILSSLLMLVYFIVTQKSNWFLNLILSLPTLLIIVPFIEMFPIGLGLKILFVSSILTVLCFGLLLPVFGSFSRKPIWSIICLLVALGFFVKAHLNSNYSNIKAKPNSLVYYFNADKKQAYWATYDKNLDIWTKSCLGEKPQVAKEISNNLKSKYESQFTFATKAPLQSIAEPTILFLQDTIQENQRILKIQIIPNRVVNRYDIYASEKMIINNLKANGAQLTNQKTKVYPRDGKQIINYYVVNNEPLILDFSIPKNQKLQLSLLESSFDLLTNTNFKMAKRQPWMIATPFVINDAILLEKEIKPSSKLEIARLETKRIRLAKTVQVDSTKVQ